MHLCYNPCRNRPACGDAVPRSSDIDVQGRSHSFVHKVLTDVAKFLYADIVLSHFTYGIIKISVILFYKRIFAVVWFRKLANVALIVVGSWTVAAVLVSLMLSGA